MAFQAQRVAALRCTAGILLDAMAEIVGRALAGEHRGEDPQGEGIVTDDAAQIEAALVEALDAPALHARLQAALRVLAAERPREAEMVAAYFGLGERPRRENHSQIADRTGMSRERVRQIAVRGLRYLNGVMGEERAAHPSGRSGLLNDETPISDTTPCDP